MLKEEIKKRNGEIIYSASSIVAPFAGMVCSIIANRYVAPVDMGTIQSVLLVVTYVTVLQLGVFSGISRNIAYYKAQAKMEIVQKMVDTSHFVSIFIGLIGVVLGICYLIYVLVFNPQPILIWSAALLTATLLFSAPTLHLDATFRSGQEFKKLGIIKLNLTWIQLLSTFLSVLFGYIGYIISQILNSVLGFFLRRKKAPFKYKHQQNIGSYKELVSIGFPIMISGYIWTIIMVADQTYIAMYLGQEQLGYYTIARQCTAAISVIPTALISLLYPKAAARYGYYGTSKSLKPFYWKSLLLLSVVIIPVSIVGCLVLPLFVDFAMPKYHNGIIVGQIALITGITAIYSGPSVVFGVLRKNIVNIIVSIVLFGLYWLVMISMPNVFSTIEAVAWLKMGILSFFMFYSLSLSYYYISKD